MTTIANNRIIEGLDLAIPKPRVEKSRREPASDLALEALNLESPRPPAANASTYSFSECCEDFSSVFNQYFPLPVKRRASCPALGEIGTPVQTSHRHETPIILERDTPPVVLPPLRLEDDSAESQKLIRQGYTPYGAVALENYQPYDPNRIEIPGYVPFGQKNDPDASLNSKIAIALAAAAVFAILLQVYSSLQ